MQCKIFFKHINFVIFDLYLEHLWNLSKYIDSVSMLKTLTVNRTYTCVLPLIHVR